MRNDLSEKLSQLQSEVVEKENANEELKRQIAENLEEIASIKKVIASYQIVLDFEKGSLPLPDAPVAGVADSIASDRKSTHALQVNAGKARGYRKPADMLNPKYQGFMQKETVLAIMQKEPTKKFSTSEFMKEMFQPDSKDEEQSVRAAIGSVLSRGVKDGSWKGGRGLYYLEEKESEPGH